MSVSLPLWAPPADLRRRILRPYQAGPAADLRAGLATADRGQLHMYPGAGKTTVTLDLAAERAGDQGLVIVSCPQIDNLEQWVVTSKAVYARPLHFLAICSDKSVCPEGVVTTDPGTIAEWLAADTDHPKLLACTNASAVSLQRAVQLLEDRGIPVPAAVLKIVDEAHHSAGQGSPVGARYLYNPDHTPGSIDGPVLSVTATPREIEVLDRPAPTRGKPKRRELQDHLVPTVYSMDDEEVYGRVFATYTLRDGQTDGVVPPLIIVPVAVRRSTIDRLTSMDERERGPLAGADPHLAAAAFVTARATTAHGSKQVLTYHNTVAAAESMQGLMQDAALANMTAAGLQAHSVSGHTPSPERRALLDTLRRADGATPMVTRNADVFAEAVDLPRTDAIVVAAPRKRHTRWVQALGRTLRMVEGKTARVFVPVIIEDTTDRPTINADSHALLAHSIGHMVLYEPSLMNEITPDTHDLGDLPLRIPISAAERTAMGHSSSKLHSLFAATVAQERTTARKRVSRRYEHVFFDEGREQFHAYLSTRFKNEFGDIVSNRLCDQWYETADEAARAVDEVVITRGLELPLNFARVTRRAQNGARQHGARQHATITAAAGHAGAATEDVQAAAAGSPASPATTDHATPVHDTGEFPITPSRPDQGIHYCQTNQAWIAKARVQWAGPGRTTTRVCATYEEAVVMADALAERYQLERRRTPNRSDRLVDVRSTLQHTSNSARAAVGYEPDAVVPGAYFAYAPDGTRLVSAGFFRSAAEASVAAKAAARACDSLQVATRRKRALLDPRAIRTHEHTVRAAIAAELAREHVPPMSREKRERATVVSANHPSETPGLRFAKDAATERSADAETPPAVETPVDRRSADAADAASRHKIA